MDLVDLSFFSDGRAADLSFFPDGRAVDLSFFRMAGSWISDLVLAGVVDPISV